ncbi:MAG: CHASE4 domain-containing protein [Anaerolineae bacterium]
MSLRTKTWLFIGTLLASLTVALSVAAHAMLLRSFADLEIQDTREHVARTVNSLYNDLDALNTLCRDWAFWDDTYAFVANANPEYVQTNLVDAAFAGAELNLMVYLDAAGETVYAKAFDLEAETSIPLPEGLQAHLSDGALLLQRPDHEVTGIILLPEGPMLVAAQPILTSEAKGPSRGTLVMGRYLSARQVQRLSEAIRLPVAIYPVGDARVPPELAPGAPPVVQPRDDETVAGYALLDDIYGQPALALRVDAPRTIYQQGQATVLSFLWWQLLAGLALGAAGLLFLERLILARVARLSARVGEIGACGNAAMRVSASGNDELARLAHAVNGMLAALERTQSDLQASEARYRTLSATLAQTVEERTTDLRRVKERVEAIFNSSSDAILVTGPTGEIEQANPELRQMFGYEADAVFRQPVTLIAEASHAPALMEALQAALAGDRPERVEFLARRCDGSVFDADMAVAPVANNSAQRRSLVCSVRDISLRKRMEAELRNALEREKELSALKTRFVAMASHDFRTPLATIKITVDALANYGDRMTPAQKAERFARVADQVEHMTRLLEDVLAFGQMDSATAQFNPAPLDLDRLCQEIVAEFVSAASETHRLEYVCTGECVEVHADEKLVRRIITNLLSNAIKYSPQGGRVQLALAHDGDAARLRVTDEGIGIPESDQKRLFVAFHRAANVGEIKGSGLGLAIVKRAVDLHGGAITCESEVGKGATFTVTLPTVPKAGPDDSPDAASVEERCAPATGG